ncbi:hypothetical protein MBLNU230_g1812t1 [Neophaeotheca triangularis]
MPIWPFRKRRRNSPKKEDAPAHPPASEKARADGASTPTPAKSQVQRETSKRRKREPTREDIKAKEAGFANEKQVRPVPEHNKENAPASRGSIENITALPVSRRLDSSPHLRPVDMEPAKIPYSFRGHSASHTSLQPESATGRPSRPQTLRSKRSANDSGTPQRRRSSKKRKDEHLREEEIRSMTAPMPIPKRHGGPGEGLMRRDSKKFRGINRDSNVSLPLEGSIHSSMSGIPEQRGWEIGGIGMFSARPAVRLSGHAQYARPGSVQGTSSPLSPNTSRAKEKAPASRSSDRKRATIGQEADDFDASDLRMLLERDQKRREKRKLEQQEKLDKKLQKEGRHRANSDRRKREAREAEEVKRADDARARAVEEARTRRMMTPPTAVHPALRDGGDESASSPPENVGLGIGAAISTDAPQNILPTTQERGTENTGTYLNYRPNTDIPENPFEGSPAGTPMEDDDRPLPVVPGSFTPAARTPTEERPPVVRTSQASQTATPPLSPASNPRAMSSVSRLSDLRRISTPDTMHPPSYPSERRISETKDGRRAGAWATFFRRGGTNLKKPQGEYSPSEFSFSNTSRESMVRQQPIPAHLSADPPQVAQRRKSGAPVRTQSKFREDLPELPISPPDSRVHSPDLPSNASASIAAAQRQQMPPPPKPMNIPGRGESNIRHSFPDPSSAGGATSPGTQAQAMVSPSLASVDSEGSWLAGGPGQRASIYSAIGRSNGSLSKRNPDFVGSYEELGVDKDAEYTQRTKPSTKGKEAVRDRQDDASVLTETPAATSGEPLKVHDSVRRKPTLIHRNQRERSREGLLTDYAGQSASLHGAEASDDEEEEQYPRESRVEKARSVNMGRGHARQMSAGSAKLLDVGPSSKRASMDASSALDARSTASAGHSPAPPRQPES